VIFFFFSFSCSSKDSRSEHSFPSVLGVYISMRPVPPLFRRLRFLPSFFLFSSRATSLPCSFWMVLSLAPARNSFAFIRTRWVSPLSLFRTRVSRRGPLSLTGSNASFLRHLFFFPGSGRRLEFSLWVCRLGFFLFFLFEVCGSYAVRSISLFSPFPPERSTRKNSSILFFTSLPAGIHEFLFSLPPVFSFFPRMMTFDKRQSFPLVLKGFLSHQRVLILFPSLFSGLSIFILIAMPDPVFLSWESPLFFLGKIRTPGLPPLPVLSPTYPLREWTMLVPS